MKTWLMPVLASAFLAACGAQQEEISADQPAHSVVVTRLPEGVSPDQISAAEVRALSVDVSGVESGEELAALFAAGDALQFSALTSDEGAEASTESSRSDRNSKYYKNRNDKYGNGYYSNYYGNTYSTPSTSTYGNYYGNYYGNTYGNYYGNYYGNTYSNCNSRCDDDCSRNRCDNNCSSNRCNPWSYNRDRDCFNTGSNYYYRNKRTYNYGGYNYYTYYR